ncbi:general secretion pathway protein E/type IV pilus assembly protein PilB [Mucilaginibacter mallensis]|uniref:General secretion pathway protein E/type IV pilus assembly protein PilB n=1 Tax=Mucilaginibacter mallensis TaxID=652787 RepID=A0A1H2CAT1_MUCMA|nr:GspE/PulE family protein [Mucilaginibacter mallensis]SDT67367.1 general secretion pathway protein E/type IV pilus assembly protein PilB [Mucilaginibacter mallensis]
MDLNRDITLLTENIHWLSKEQAWHYRILPKSRGAGALFFYCEDTADLDNLGAELEIIFGLEIQLEKIAASQVSRLLAKYYLKHETAKSSAQLNTTHNADDFLNNLIQEAKNLKSSDIHIESYEHKCRVRVRIDGMMVERYLLKREDYPALINKIKIKANLDISEKRLPQDGRINFIHQGEQFDIRVSVLPTLYGEKVVLRLLNSDATEIDLNSLGFSDFDLENYLQGAKMPNGILLISGPTGSGKTTTLYATLKLLNKETRNVLTIEDPIEYTLEGINQVQLKESIGLGFASALRTFLRQDPDVIMVGEIRDTETANMAIRAALTGHLVLSTIHTNSAWGTVSRLIDMGVQPFLVASTLNTTVAQRLVRLLCPSCKEQQEFDQGLYPRQFKPYSKVDNHFIPKGCDTCHFTGYKGRKAVYEVIPIDQELATEIKAGNMNVNELLKERGIHTLAENAFNLFSDGLTSIEEIYPLLLNY